jgi:hypothetical protein
MTQKRMNRRAREPTAHTTAQIEELKQIKLQQIQQIKQINLATVQARQLEMALTELRHGLSLAHQRVETSPSLAHQRGTIAYSVTECVPACPSPPTTATGNIKGSTDTTFQEDVCVQGQSPTGLCTADEDNLGARTGHLPSEANGEFPAALPKGDLHERPPDLQHAVKWQSGRRSRQCLIHALE